MSSIKFFDRTDGHVKVEKVFGERAVAYMHGSRWDQQWVRAFACRLPIVSYLYGWAQTMPWTKRKVRRFIRDYGVDTTEFLKTVEGFSSFNDFFIRKLKTEARPICKEGACLPADARYRFFPSISAADGFFVKGQKFCLEKFLNSKRLAKKYEHGAMCIARLCPTDYHRFHFPCDGVAESSKLINGFWYSVNPISLKYNVHVMTENKRLVTRLVSPVFGEVLIVAVGATNVGSIHETYEPGRGVKKGQEMGYFSFGGSALVLLFEPGKLEFSNDLIEESARGLEIRALMGTQMGLAVASHLRQES